MDIEVFIAFKVLLLTLSIVEQETLLNDEEPVRQKRNKTLLEQSSWFTAQGNAHLYLLSEQRS